MADAESSPLARGVRWLTTIPATVGFCFLLCLVFAAELYVRTTVGYDVFVRLFVATRDPSLGWLLAPLAHLPGETSHLISSLAQVLVFGGIVERRLGRARYAGLLAVSGLATTAAQVASYSVTDDATSAAGTLGASGIALALVGLVVVDSVRYRLATDEWTGEVTWVWVLLGGFIVARALVDLFLPAPGVGVVGHLTGVFIGLGCGLVRPTGAVVASGTDTSR